VNYTHTSFIAHTQTHHSKDFFTTHLKCHMKNYYQEIICKKCLQRNIYSMYSNAIANTHGSRENRKAYFLQLVEGNGIAGGAGRLFIFCYSLFHL